MGVHDDVRRDAEVGPRHVLLAVHDAQRALLAVPRRKLVPDLGDLQSSQPHLCELEAVLVQAQHHVVHHPHLGSSDRYGAVLPVVLRDPHLVAGHGGQGRRPPDQDVVSQHPHAGLAEAVVVQLGVVPPPEGQRPVVLGPAEDVHGLVPLVLLLGRVAAVGDGAHEAPVHGGLAQHETVLLVVPRVAHDEHHGVGPRRHLPEPQVVHGPRAHEGLHGVVHDAGVGVHARVEVRPEDADGLLPHGALEDVAGAHVVVGEGDDGRADAEDHCGVDLRVRVGPAVGARLDKVLDEHRDHGALLLLGVEVLDEAVAHQVAPDPLARLDPLHVGAVDDDLLRGVVHDVHGPGAPAAVRGDLDLQVLEVLLDGDLRVDVLAPPEELQGVPQLRRALVLAHPDAV
mmetsp:Transcript_54211/g.168110  ORF Transcript_54211/g.168110 Transcript_54211/m.168110 type:complete len:398 (+) Transcript_54211:789-1982(+)